jgi:hypothetical protein
MQMMDNSPAFLEFFKHNVNKAFDYFNGTCVYHLDTPIYLDKPMLHHISDIEYLHILGINLSPESSDTFSTSNYFRNYKIFLYAQFTDGRNEVIQLEAGCYCLENLSIKHLTLSSSIYNNTRYVNSQVISGINNFFNFGLNLSKIEAQEETELENRICNMEQEIEDLKNHVDEFRNRDSSQIHDYRLSYANDFILEGVSVGGKLKEIECDLANIEFEIQILKENPIELIKNNLLKR